MNSFVQSTFLLCAFFLSPCLANLYTELLIGHQVFEFDYVAGEVYHRKLTYVDADQLLITYTDATALNCFLYRRNDRSNLFYGISVVYDVTPIATVKTHVNFYDEIWDGVYCYEPAMAEDAVLALVVQEDTDSLIFQRLINIPLNPDGQGETFLDIHPEIASSGSSPLNADNTEATEATRTRGVTFSYISIVESADPSGICLAFAQGVTKGPITLHDSNNVFAARGYVDQLVCVPNKSQFVHDAMAQITGYPPMQRADENNESEPRNTDP